MIFYNFRKYIAFFLKNSNFIFHKKGYINFCRQTSCPPPKLVFTVFSDNYTILEKMDKRENIQHFIFDNTWVRFHKLSATFPFKSNRFLPIFDFLTLTDQEHVLKTRLLLDGPTRKNMKLGRRFRVATKMQHAARWDNH